MKKAAIIYWTKSGNTKKVADAIKEGLDSVGFDVSYLRVEEAKGLDYFDYDLVCIGFPSYEWSTPRPMTIFLRTNLAKHRKEGLVKGSAPKVPGKNALVFCTYSGPHTGIREAIPAGLYAGQFFEHIGFTVLDEWYVLSEFHGQEKASTKGRMGDIRGKPTEEDLAKIKEDTIRLAKSL
ncbi:MAG: flavodoxin family protein [Candidatus Thorarchaeota archaeon]